MIYIVIWLLAVCCFMFLIENATKQDKLGYILFITGGLIFSMAALIFSIHDLISLHK
jgi:hypothetical protein